MRSDPELQIFIFRSEKLIGLVMQSDSAKSDGTKSDLIIGWPKSSDFRLSLAQNLTFRPIELSNRKMASVFNQATI